MSPHPALVDLHTHSDCSDGEWSPAALVTQAAAAGLKAMALTDHDTLAGLPPALEAGRQTGVTVVPGVELSACHGDAEVHILGLFIDPGREPGRFVELRRRRTERIVRILERLDGIGIRLEPSSVLSAAGNGEDRVLGRPHVARAMVAAGMVKTVPEAFSRYLRDRGPADVPKDKIPAAEAIELVRTMGGLALLAHPGVGNAEAQLPFLAELGLDGLEAYHPKHSAETTARLLRWAGSRGLAVSGGSDFHRAEPGTNLGKPRVPWSVFEALRGRREALAPAPS